MTKQKSTSVRKTKKSWKRTKMKERSGRNTRSIGDGELANELIGCCLVEIPIEKWLGVTPKSWKEPIRSAEEAELGRRSPRRCFIRVPPGNCAYSETSRPDEENWRLLCFFGGLLSGEKRQILKCFMCLEAACPVDTVNSRLACSRLLDSREGTKIWKGTRRTGSWKEKAPSFVASTRFFAVVLSIRTCSTISKPGTG